MTTSPSLEPQCWHCGLALGNRPVSSCPSCGTPLRPPGTAAPAAAPEAGGPPPAQRAPLPHDPVLTPALRTALLALLIVLLLAGVGVFAGRVIGS